MLKKIGSTARYEIEQMLDCKVNLQALGKSAERLARQRFSDEKLWIPGRRVIKCQWCFAGEQLADHYGV